MTDFVLDEDNDLAIANGDFVIGDVEQQNQKLLLECAKGGFKAHPTVCVNLFSYLEGENQNTLLREIKQQFISDGMEVNGLAVFEDKIVIDANY